MSVCTSSKKSKGTITISRRTFVQITHFITKFSNQANALYNIFMKNVHL